MSKHMIDPTRMMVLSLKPRFAEAIIDGTKSVELRRAKPRIIGPTRALIYATTPVKAILGSCIVDSVVSDDVNVLWDKYGSQTGIDHDDFISYFYGINIGTALLLSDANRFEFQVSLTDLRSRGGGFHPPQSFAYLDTKRSNQLLAMPALQ